MKIIKQKEVNILFICKYNRFRSKIAESYAKGKQGNSGFKIRSAGLIFDSSSRNEFEFNRAREKGIKINEKHQQLTTDLLNWADFVIVVANDIPKEVFNLKDIKGQLIIWKIPDNHDLDEKKIDNIIEGIILKIDSFFDDFSL